MRDSLEFEESIICFHSLDIDLVRSFFRIFKIKIMSSLIIKNLRCIVPCFIHCLSYWNSMFFCKTKVNIAEFWCNMYDTRSISVGCKIGSIDFMRFVSFFSMIILWKWWNIGKSYQFSPLEFSNNSIFSLSLEYCFESTASYYISLSSILYQNIINLLADSKCHIRRNRPWSCCPCKDTCSFWEFFILF